MSATQNIKRLIITHVTFIDHFWNLVKLKVVGKVKYNKIRKYFYAYNGTLDEFFCYNNEK